MPFVQQCKFHAISQQRNSSSLYDFVHEGISFILTKLSHARSAILQAADFTAAMGQHELLHWRLFFQHLLRQPRPGDKASALGSKPTASAGNDLWQAFTRMASQPKLQVRGPHSGQHKEDSRLPNC